MTEHFADRAQYLAAYAQEKGMRWKEQAQQLPKGDHFALLGLLADQLGIPLAVAMDESITKETLNKLTTKKDNGRIS
jgi:hypothetical protein